MGSSARSRTVDVLDNQPAQLSYVSEIWSSRTGNVPQAIAVLADGRHSTVIRLSDSSSEASAVIAKLRPSGAMERDRLMHGEVLPTLGITTPKFHGYHDGRGSRPDILFLEDVGDVPFNPGCPRHQRAAAKWLASLHARTRMSASPGLPTFDSARSLGLLRSSSSELSEGLRNPAIDATGKAIVASVLRHLETVEALWDRLVDSAGEVGSVMTHGTLIRRNVRVRVGPDGTIDLYPFDWDHATFGPSAIDLARAATGTPGFSANAPLRTYQKALMAEGWSIDRERLMKLRVAGTILRSVVALSWLTPRFVSTDVSKSLAQLPTYQAALAAALDRRWPRRAAV